MPLRISLRNTDFFKEIQRYLTTMHGNQVPVIELSFIDNFSWKKLSLNLIREVAGLEQEEYMYENCRDNKYFLIYLDTYVRNNVSITKIWLCKVMSEKRGWQVTRSPPLNPPLFAIYVVWSANYASTNSLDSVRGEFHHPGFDGNWPTIIRIFFSLIHVHCYWMSSPSSKWESRVRPRFHLVVFMYGVNQEN